MVIKPLDKFITDNYGIRIEDLPTQVAETIRGLDKVVGSAKQNRKLIQNYLELNVGLHRLKFFRMILSMIMVYLINKRQQKAAITQGKIE